MIDDNLKELENLSREEKEEVLKILKELYETGNSDTNNDSLLVNNLSVTLTWY